jgi:hypothetical protein
MPYRPSFYLGKMDELRARFGGKCVWEGAKDKGECALGLDRRNHPRPLEFAHKHPTGCVGRGRGRADRYHDVKNNPECYQLMCRKHHVLYDADFWARKERERREEKEAWAARARAGTLPEEPPF